MEVAGKVSENIEIISPKLQDMEGAGKGSECGKVRVHRNVKSKSIAKTWRGGKRVRVRKGSECIALAHYIVARFYGGGGKRVRVH